MPSAINWYNYKYDKFSILFRRILIKHAVKNNLITTIKILANDPVIDVRIELIDELMRFEPDEQVLLIVEEMKHSADEYLNNKVKEYLECKNLNYSVIE